METASKKKYNLLLVNHKVNKAEFIKKILTNNNFTLVETEKISEILPLLNTNTPHLILINTKTITNTIIDLCNTVNSNNSLNGIPIFILSTDLSDSNITKVVNAGATDIMQHPINKHLLISKIKSQIKLTKTAESALKNKYDDLLVRYRTLSKKVELLRESEDKLNSAQKLAKLGHYNLDFSTGIWTSSKELDEIFGIDTTYTHSIEGWVNLIHPDFREEMDSYLTNEVIIPKKPFNKEYKIVNQKKKKEIWVHGLGTLKFDENGELTNMLGAIQDITDRKKIELKHEQVRVELQKEQELLKALLENIPDTIYFKDRKSRFTRINKAQAKLLGIENPNDALMKTDFDYFDNEHAKKAYEDEQTIIKTGNPLIDKIEKIVDADKHVHWVSTTKVPTRDVNEKINGIVGVTRDITEEKLSAIALKNSETLLRESQAIANVGSWKYLPDNDTLLWSDQTYRIFGYEPNEVKPNYQFFINSIHEDDKEKVNRAYINSIEQKLDNYEVEHRIIQNKTGKELYLYEKCSHVKDEKGNIIQSIGMVSDITTRRTAELKLEKTNQALRKIIKATTYKSGIDYFENMAKTLEEITDATYSFIGENMDSDKVKTIALSHKNKILKNFTYDLKDTPCDSVIDEKTCIYPSKITKKFPKDQLLIDMGIEGYAGTPIFNFKNECLGIIVSLYEKPMQNIDFVESIFEIVANKIAGEMERLKSEKQLKNTLSMLTESEARFKALHNASFGGIAIHDMGIILETNRGMAEMTGYSIDELIGMNGLLLISEDTRDSVLEKIKNQYQKPYEAMGVRKNGKRYPLRIEGRQIPYKGKQVRVVEFRDITEQKRTEEIIKENAERYRNLQENMPSGVIVYRPINKGSDFKIIGFNHAAETISGLKMKKVLGKNLNDVLPGIEKTNVYKTLKKVNKTGVPVKLEPEHIGYNKNEKWTENQIYKLKNGEIVAVFDDVTEKIKSDRIIKQSEERYKALAENIPGAIYLCKNDKNKSLIYLNSEIKKLTGYSQKEFYNEKIKLSDLYYQKEKANIKATIKKALDKKQPYHLTYQIKTKKGEWKWIEEYGSGIFENNKLSFIEGNLIDITERKNTEIINIARINITNFATKHNANKLLTYILDEAEKLTQSEIGFYHFVNENQEDITLNAWSTNTLQNMCTTKPENSHYPISKAGVWVDCIRERKPIIHNDYNSLTHKNGLPKGHAPVIRELVVPVFRDRKIVAVLGVGNKKDNYTKADIKIVQSLADMAFETVLRKHSEESLIENENQLQLIFDSSPAIMFLVNKNATITKMNKTGLSFLGTTFEEIQNNAPGDAFNCIVAIQSNKGCGSGYACKSCGIRNTITEVVKSTRTKNKVEAELKIIRDNVIQKFTVLISATIATHTPETNYLVTIDDITERKKTELALKSSEARFRTIIESANDAIFIADAKTGILVDVNIKGQELIGKTKEEIIDQNQTSLYPRKDKTYAETMFKEDIKPTESSVVREATLLHKTGGRIPVEISPALIELDNGKKYVVSFFRNITKRKIAEQALEESKVRFKHLADMATEGIVIHDDGDIIDVNEMFIKMSGYNKEELLGENVIEKFVPKLYHNIVFESMKQKNPAVYEIEARKKDGTLMPIEVKARDISDQGQATRVISVRDISEQKQIQQKILQAVINTEEQERKRVAQELHDGLGPILSASKLYVETFLRSNNKVYKEKAQKNLLSGIEEALKQVSTISNNLSPHVLNDFGLEAAIKKFVDRVMSLNKINIDFSFDHKIALSKEIEITIYRLTNELVNNTIKYAQAEHIFIHIFTDEKGFICLLYKDDGIGFDFEETKKKKGGMGLFNITNRVESFNGIINFSKAKERGIIYDIKIPLKA